MTFSQTIRNHIFIRTLQTNLSHMKRTLLLITLLISGLASQAQCNPSIAGSTAPITLNMITLTSGDSWVCESLLSTDNGAATNIYLENNASLNCFGCTSTIWATAGTTVNIYSNGTPTVYHVPSASVIDVSGMATTIACPTITYDYTNAPGGGCVAGVGVNEYADNSLNVYPNPNDGRFSIEMPESLTANHQIAIYSMEGRLVKTIDALSVKNSIDLSNLESGFYIIHLLNEDKTLYTSKSFVIK